LSILLALQCPYPSLTASASTFKTVLVLKNKSYCATTKLVVIAQNKEGRSSVDLSSGIKITPVTPRPEIASFCGSGDQNCDSLAAETTANDSDDGETPDIDLTVVGTSLQKQPEEPS